jgi:hypothetical protein
MKDATGLILQMTPSAPDVGSQSLLSKSVFLSCGTRPKQDRPEHSAADERRTRVDAAFDWLEKMCPKLFSPAGTLTDPINEKLRRDYVDTDAYL